jgi:hypothetical protein
LWNSSGPGKLTQPESLYVTEHVSYTAVRGWGVYENTTSNYVWLVVYGAKEERDKLDHEMLKDLVRMRSEYVA